MIGDYINANLGQFWITFGIILLIIEFLVFGLGSMVLLFVGIGAVLTGLLMMIGVLPETWTAGVASAGIISGITTTLLWKPMRKFQGERTPTPDRSSDLIGLEFVTEQNITVQHAGTYRYSGIEWKVEIDQTAGVDSIATGSRVRVTTVDVGLFRVAPTVTE